MAGQSVKGIQQYRSSLDLLYGVRLVVSCKLLGPLEGSSLFVDLSKTVNRVFLTPFWEL